MSETQTPTSIKTRIQALKKCVMHEDLASFLAHERPRIHAMINALSYASNEKARFLFLKKVIGHIDTLSLEERKQWLAIFPEWADVDFHAHPPWIQLNTKAWPKTTTSQQNMNALSSTQISNYEQLGFTGPFHTQSISQEQINCLYEIALAKPRKNGMSVQMEDPRILQLATNKEIIAKVASVLGNNIVLLSVIIHVVPAQVATSNKTLMSHSDLNPIQDRQDNSHFEHHPNGFLNVWFSLTTTCEQRSPLHFFPGTHCLGMVPLPAYFHTAQNDSQYLDYYCKALSLQGYRRDLGRLALHMDVLYKNRNKLSLNNVYRTTVYTNPGDYIIFNPHTLHGTLPNQHDQPRIAISLRYKCATDKPLKRVDFGYSLEQLKALYNLAELTTLGLATSEEKPCAIQVLGDQHHKDYQIIDKAIILKMMQEKRQWGTR